MSHAYVVQLIKGGQLFAVVFDDSSRNSAIRQLGTWAADPTTSFSWYDAAVLSKQVRSIKTTPSIISNRSKLPE